jgi:UDP-N-acetyl-D-glucosamine/UDP-N-acetyl-D-galactosamine dehydrogenase
MKKPEGIVGVVGLGYVGLPLACAFARHLRVIGFDVSAERVAELQRGVDGNDQTPADDIQNPNLTVTTDPKRLRECRYIIVAVPTPVDAHNAPDLLLLTNATHIVGENLSRGALVVFESTVYPGVTEDICLPILEKHSGLRLGDFQLGYSPERINPGDNEHTIDKIAKIVSGHDAAALAKVAALYALVTRSVYRAPNIMTAEAAKVIENIQRDLNIALMNELSLIFERLGLRTDEVLAAAATKWNFHPYHPGLVGGHCIGVDPYYLTHRAEQLGYHPQVILAGRRLNDSMAIHVGEMVISALRDAGKAIKGATVLILGLTFKENVPDIRNSKVLGTIRYLQEHGACVIGCDPLLGADTVRQHFGVENKAFDQIETVDCVLVVNKHNVFRKLTLDQLRAKMNPPILLDLKNLFPRKMAEDAGFCYRSL